MINISNGNWLFIHYFGKQKKAARKLRAALGFRWQKSDYFARCLRMVSAIRRLPMGLR